MKEDLPERHASAAHSSCCLGSQAGISRACSNAGPAIASPQAIWPPPDEQRDVTGHPHKLLPPPAPPSRPVARQRPHCSPGPIGLAAAHPVLSDCCSHSVCNNAGVSLGTSSVAPAVSECARGSTRARSRGVCMRCSSRAHLAGLAHRHPHHRGPQVVRVIKPKPVRGHERCSTRVRGPLRLRQDQQPSLGL